MSVRSLIRAGLTILLSVAITVTTYLYLYPAFQGCVFPVPGASSPSSYLTTLFQHTTLSLTPSERAGLAPFRLLVFGDPQLEGDSSLPDPEDGLQARLSKHWKTVTADTIAHNDRLDRLKASARAIITDDLPRSFQAARKRVDLFGNDYYLAHIYRTLHWWSQPTHVAVLGDLIGSQWVTDDEFEWRGWRYWNRVFRNGHRVEDGITTPGAPVEEALADAVEWEGLDLPTKKWARRVINIAGNHDIGYAGDISPNRIARFEKVFGRANWDVRFRLPASKTSSNQTGDAIAPTLHLVVLNTLSLDTPSLTPQIQDQTYEYVNSAITASRPVEDRSSFTLLLTHLPLHKAAGVCVDGPHFDFYTEDDYDGKWKNGGLQEQNHLSEHVSRNGMLEGLFGMSGDSNAAAQGKGRAGLIMTGHDHEGCDVWHHIPVVDHTPEDDETHQPRETSKRPWQAVKWQDANFTASHTGIREVTLRSMMGDFGGNAGLLSAWFDFDVGEWRFEIQTCKAGVQHIWWAVHVLDLITVILSLAYLLLSTVVDGKGPTVTLESSQDGKGKVDSAKPGGTVEHEAMPSSAAKGKGDPT